MLTFQSYQTRGIWPDLVKLGEANTKWLTASSMIMVFKDLQVGLDSTVVMSLCVQLAALWARGLRTDVN